jgi:hypothetical protein
MGWAVPIAAAARVRMNGGGSAPPEAGAAPAEAGTSSGSANGAPPPPAAENGAVVVDPNVERGLAASVRVFDFCKQRLISLSEGEEETQITRAELVRLKRAGLAMNQAITRLVQARNAREDRYIIELHLLRQILQREATDRDANRARVYEMLRKNLTAEDATTASAAAAASATTSVSANPLNAPSAASLAVDKALAAVGRIDASLQALSANGTSTVHGAGLISAHNARQEALAELA